MFRYSILKQKLQLGFGQLQQEWMTFLEQLGEFLSGSPSNELIPVKIENKRNDRRK